MLLWDVCSGHATERCWHIPLLHSYNENIMLVYKMYSKIIMHTFETITLPQDQEFPFYIQTHHNSIVLMLTLLACWLG